MAYRAKSINPEILIWARETAGYNVEEISHKMKPSSKIVEEWEKGVEFPTYRQLEKLAKYYKRPIAVFFFPEPPFEPKAEEEFRTLPNSEIEKLIPDTLFALREGRVWRGFLRELSGGKNPASKLITKEVSARNVQDLVGKTRSFLGISLEDQKTWKDNREAFNNWRHLFEKSGVFVFKRSMKQREISGFCLHDSEFPVIVINNSTSLTRQIFTLFHELGHLIFNVSGITKLIPDYFESLDVDNKKIEVACNNFASEFLLPMNKFPWEKVKMDELERSVENIANDFNVSREVVLRKLLDEGWVDQKTYENYALKWHKQFETSRKRGESHGDYYRTRISYMGEGYLNLAFSQYRVGNISQVELANYIGVKARNLLKLEGYLHS